MIYPIFAACVGILRHKYQSVISPYQIPMQLILISVTVGLCVGEQLLPIQGLRIVTNSPISLLVASP